MAKAATQTRHNRTITVDFHDETTYSHLPDDGKEFLEWVLAFILSRGFQRQHQATCRGGGCLTRHSHYIRVRLGGIIIWADTVHEVQSCVHGPAPLCLALSLDAS